MPRAAALPASYELAHTSALFGEILPQRSNTLLKTFARRLAAVLTVVLLCFNLYYELAPGYIVGPEWKIAFAAGFAALLGVSLFYGVPKGARGTP